MYVIIPERDWFERSVLVPIGPYVGNPESFNDWGGRGCRKSVLVLGGYDAKIAPPGDIFDQPLRELS